MSKQAGAVVSYKRALINAKAIQKDSALKGEKEEKFLSDISPFLTKKGVVRKNLSKKRQEEFNKLVTEYKETAKSRKQIYEERQEKALSKAKSRGTYSDKAGQKKTVNVFKSDAVKGLINNYGFDSEQIVSLMKTFNNLSAKQIVGGAKHLLNKLEHDTPEEARDFLTVDDAYLELEEYLADKYGYPDTDDEEIPFD